MERTKITLEEWKASVRTSDYLREGEQATFSEPHTRHGTTTISASIDRAPQVTLGFYFVADHDKNVEGTGWHH